MPYANPTGYKPLKAYRLPVVADTKAAWAAGIIDGEGCISAYNAKPSNGRTRQVKLNLSVANTDPRMVYALLDIFAAGRVYQEQSDSSPKAFRPRIQPLFYWKVSSISEISAILARLAPYLITKREEADLLLAICRALSNPEESFIHERDTKIAELAAIKQNRLKVSSIHAVR